MDIKAKIDEVVNKVKSDDKFAEKFKSEPIKAVEDVLGVDLPDDQVNGIIEGVKAKVNLSGVTNKLGGVADKIGGMFGKK